MQLLFTKGSWLFTGITPLLDEPHVFIGDPIDLKCTLKAAENKEIPSGIKLELIGLPNGSPLQQKILVNDSSMISVAVDEILKTPKSESVMVMNIVCNIITNNCTEMMAIQFLKINSKNILGRICLVFLNNSVLILTFKSQTDNMGTHIKYYVVIHRHSNDS